MRKVASSSTCEFLHQDFVVIFDPHGSTLKKKKGNLSMLGYQVSFVVCMLTFNSV